MRNFWKEGGKWKGPYSSKDLKSLSSDDQKLLNLAGHRQKSPLDAKTFFIKLEDFADNFDQVITSYINPSQILSSYPTQIASIENPGQFGFMQFYKFKLQNPSRLFVGLSQASIQLSQGPKYANISLSLIYSADLNLNHECNIPIKPPYSRCILHRRSQCPRKRRFHRHRGQRNQARRLHLSHRLHPPNPKQDIRGDNLVLLVRADAIRVPPDQPQPKFGILSVPIC